MLKAAISIAMASFRGERFLRAPLDSLAAQRWLFPQSLTIDFRRELLGYSPLREYSLDADPGRDRSLRVTAAIL